jgi:simple sugar transport system substrate-binding protein
MRCAAALALVLALGVLAGCGGTTEVREPTVVVTDGAAAAGDARPARPAGGVRIAVVTHGQASSPFWAIVRNGVEAAARQMDVVVAYRAPDVYSLQRMETMIDQAVASRPDGLVVSIPEPGLAGAIRRAVRAGIPVVSINSGSDRFRDLGILAHVGQPEFRAGFEAGRRMADAGVSNGLCVNQEVGNSGLDQRCAGFEAGMRRDGGRATVLGVDVQDPDQAQQRIAQAVKESAADGILTLGTGSALPALKAVRAGGFGRAVQLATFDLSPEVLEAVRIERMLFAVDQQPYLQGYLPIVLLAERSRHMLFPARAELIPTGPDFVTSENAEAVLELTRRGFR